MLTRNEAEKISRDLVAGKTTLRKAAENFPCTYGTIRRDLISYNLPTSPPCGKKPVPRCFQYLEDEYDWYWYGYFMGDSSVTTDYCITLSSVDHEHLGKFINHYKLQDRVKIRCNKEAVEKQQALYSLSVNSKELVRQLRGLGFVKGHKRFRVLPVDPPNAFWRGMFDADGGVGYLTRPSYTAPIHFVKAFYKWVDLPGRGAHGYAGSYRVKENGTTAEIKYSGLPQANVLFGKLYRGAKIYLDRKYAMPAKLLGCEKMQSWLDI